MARMVLLDSTGNLENTVQMAKMGKVAPLGQLVLEEHLELAEHQVKLEQVKHFIVVCNRNNCLLDDHVRSCLLGGIPGLPGVAGASGIPGSAGTPGTPGDAGLPGESGTAGAAGTAGVAGAAGKIQIDSFFFKCFIT